MSILDFLGLSTGSETSDPVEVESIRKIARRLEEMDPNRARYIAAFAYLLGRVAHADLDISDRESAEMERIVMEKGHLPREQAVMTVEIAKRQNRLFGHVENFLVAREFKDLATREQKMELLDCLFAVSAADGSISTREDGEVRQIAAELLLERPDFIEVRSRYRGFLDVLRKPEVEGSG
jgi:uncharacterized tellurite resistance protein B-like protein